MKRILAVLLLFAGCSTESTVGPSKSPTFVRYLNGSFNDEAQTVLETTDKGLLILANTFFPSTDIANPSIYRGNLIKTDEFGNVMWQQFFPALTESDKTLSYKAYGMAINPAGGYVLTGEVIQGNNPKLLLITVDNDGKNPNVKVTATPAPRRGISVAVIPAPSANAGNFRVVATITDKLSSAADNIMLAEFDKSTLTPVPLTTFNYGSGPVVDNALPNRLFIDSRGNSYWGGTVKKNNSNNSMRYIGAPPNRINVLFDITLGDPTNIETAGDMVRYGNGFAFVGTSTGQALADSSRISFRRLTESGTEILAGKVSVDPSLLFNNKSITGNSLCVAQDGGVVLLATITNPTNTTDYCLIKLDTFGNTDTATGNLVTTWTRLYGGRFDDQGKCIITTSDGGLVVLGTTTLANVKTLLLMKTDKDGKIPGL